jgi:hypothetical protein
MLVTKTFRKITWECRRRGGGGGLLAEDAAAVAVAVGTAAVAAAPYCRGRRECNIPVQKNGHKEVEKKPKE